eukprot:UN07656
MFDKTWLLLVVLVSSVLLVTCQDNNNNEDESSAATSYDLSDHKKMIWRKCPTTGPKAESGIVNAVKVHEVYLDSCSNQDDSKCPLILGSDQTLLINMTATVNETVLTEEVKGKIGVWLPFNIGENSGACVSSGLCPLNEGENGLYSITIPISSSYPEIPVT